MFQNFLTKVDKVNRSVPNYLVKVWHGNCLLYCHHSQLQQSYPPASRAQRCKQVESCNHTCITSSSISQRRTSGCTTIKTPVAKRDASKASSYCALLQVSLQRPRWNCLQLLTKVFPMWPSFLRVKVECYLLRRNKKWCRNCVCALLQVSL